MNDNYEKTPFGEDLVPDNTDLSNKGDQINVDKNDNDSEKSEKEDLQGSFSQEKAASEEGADTCGKEANGSFKGEASEEKIGEPEKSVRYGEPVSHYTPPHTYSASYYAPFPQQTPAQKKEKKRFSAGVVIAVASVCVVISLVFGAFSGLVASYVLNRAIDDEPISVNGDAEHTDASNVTEDVITVNKNNAPTKVVENIENTEEETMSTVEVVEKVSASVVEVSTLTTSNYGQYVSGGAGSGVIIAQGNGYAYIVTNYHVVGGSDYIAVRLTDESEYEAEYIDGDEYDDIAIIRIAETKELSVAKIGSSDTLRVGEGVIAIGNPLGELGGTVTDGIVSALDREITIDGVTMTLLQTNAAVNPGNSGGGLFNMAGRLVGIVNAKHQESGIEGLGFAIPIDKVYDKLIEIIEDGYIHGRVTIGIEAIYLDRISAMYYFRTTKEGVYVISAENDAFAVGDRIVSIDSKTITSENDYVKAVNELEIGSEVVIEVVRANSTKKITVTVNEYVPESIKK